MIGVSASIVVSAYGNMKGRQLFFVGHIHVFNVCVT